MIHLAIYRVNIGVACPKISIDTPGPLLPTLHNLKVFSFRTASRLRAAINKITPENGGITFWEDHVTIYPSWKDGGQEDMIVDTWPQRGIRKQDNQVEFGKQLYGTLLSVAMSPTSQQK